MATIAVFGVLAGGGAYAASLVGPDDIKRDAVRSKHIKAGNVKGIDIAKNAVGSTRITPATRRLVPVAVVLIGGNGAVAEEAHRAPITGPPAVDHNVTGIYELSFPGLGLAGNDAALCSYRGAGSAGEVGVLTGGPGTMTVHLRNSAGGGVDDSFQCAVYDL